MSRGKTLTPQVREGKSFTTNKHGYDVARFIIKCESIPYYKTAFFIRAVVRAFPLLDEEQREKLLAGIMGLPQQATTAAYLGAFENIVNRNVRVNKRISLANATKH